MPSATIEPVRAYKKAASRGLEPIAFYEGVSAFLRGESCPYDDARQPREAAFWKRGLWAEQRRLRGKFYLRTVIRGAPNYYAGILSSSQVWVSWYLEGATPLTEAAANRLLSRLNSRATTYGFEFEKAPYLPSV
jgi:hypothetical protein